MHCRNKHQIKSRPSRLPAYSTTYVVFCWQILNLPGWGRAVQLEKVQLFAVQQVILWVPNEPNLRNLRSFEPS